MPFPWDCDLKRLGHQRSCITQTQLPGVGVFTCGMCCTSFSCPFLPPPWSFSPLTCTTTIAFWEPANQSLHYIPVLLCSHFDVILNMHDGFKKSMKNLKMSQIMEILIFCYIYYFIPCFFHTHIHMLEHVHVFCDSESFDGYVDDIH